jgi:hypothetical protein
MWKSKQRNSLTHSMLLLQNLQGECAGHDRESIIVVSLQDPVLQVYFAAQSMTNGTQQFFKKTPQTPAFATKARLSVTASSRS